MSVRSRNQVRMICALLLSLTTAVTLLFRHKLAPMAEELILRQVDNQASDAINAAIGEQISSGEISYDAIVNVEKDRYGNVTAVRTNMEKVNLLKAGILQRVDEHLLNMSQEELSVPAGSVFLPELFSGQGPMVPVRVLAVRASDATFENSFTDAGINQTLHRITIDIHVDITILTWTGTRDIAVDSSVLAAETVIIGTVPTTYFDVEGESWTQNRK